MLKKYDAELVAKYSFIDSAEVKGSSMYITYTVKGVKKLKKLPIRASVDQLQSTIKNIKQEIGVSKYGKGYNADIYITA